ncbi:hypothetical protein CFPU101_34860 [Chroococcus sp. FPU101]|nr:hypothetical protein CFPU101_34860 [Chroococcus sp. FPU101]
MFCLALFDIGINLLFPYPSDPLNISPGQLNLYFDYGRSIEGKVFRQLGETDEKSSLLSQAGWLQPQDWKKLPSQPEKKENLLIASYGMSFSNQVCEAMKKIDPNLTLRLIAGPAAPPNHSFSAYLLDRKYNQANVVIFAILASSVQGLDTMSGMTWGAEVPPSFTYPKYQIKEQKLIAIQPKINSLIDLREAKKEPLKRQEFIQQLQQNDRFYNLFTFHQNFLDSSSMIRLIRRSFSQNFKFSVNRRIHTEKGFNLDWEGIAVLKLMIQEFSKTAQADGKLPIVLLLNDQGYDDHLFQALKTTLEAESIPYVSTHQIVSPTDQNNFVGDGHFTLEANQKIAQAVFNVIEQNQK